MVETIRIEESTPTYPAPPADLSDAAAAIEPAVVWGRLEAWMNRRWAKRQVICDTDSGGAFSPPLRPAKLGKAEQWTGCAWKEITPKEGPFGVILADAPHRLTFTVGDDTDVPAELYEAYRRLAEYWAETPIDGGLTEVSDGDYSHKRSANAAARALPNSGAADLLRRYR
ncbi:hypothetical protein HKX42_10325 [Salinisphaera sp. USBA-960]|nr:hypothetical protein [Salifodinibacter halophilus]NNC27269.1 hypothetical protein [Salifodinibacter halophilus]